MLRAIRTDRGWIRGDTVTRVYVKGDKVMVVAPEATSSHAACAQVAPGDDPEQAARDIASLIWGTPEEIVERVGE